jgi:hypothetical protein
MYIDAFLIDETIRVQTMDTDMPFRSFVLVGLFANAIFGLYA